MPVILHSPKGANGRANIALGPKPRPLGPSRALPARPVRLSQPVIGGRYALTNTTQATHKHPPIPTTHTHQQAHTYPHHTTTTSHSLLLMDHHHYAHHGHHRQGLSYPKGGEDGEGPGEHDYHRHTRMTPNAGLTGPEHTEHMPCELHPSSP